MLIRPSASRGKRKAPGQSGRASSKVPKLDTPNTGENSTTPAPKPTRKASSSKTKGKAVVKGENGWPEYFEELFKVYKALNTVVTFCSCRQHISTTFTMVRTSVERILKRPLDLQKVAEIKAIIPDLLRFAYIPAHEVRSSSDGAAGSSTAADREGSPDIYAPSTMQGRFNDQVLVLEFIEAPKIKRPDLDGHAPVFSTPSLSPAELKKLIEKRNDKFAKAVDELLLACNISEEADDPVAMVIQAAHDHLPLDPYGIHSHNNTGLISTEDRPSIDEIVDQIEGDEEYKDQMIYKRVFDAKEAHYGELDQPLSEPLREGIRQSLGVSRFYSHQATAINALREGKHVIVSTGTASGKSVIYQVPLLSFLEEDKDTTAMFIFPTKALAQDQKTALEHLLARCPGMEDIKIATYDGDTPQAERADIRATASVIFTNFDMIHVAILPHEDHWRRFLKNMKLLVVDELHYYNGTLGSHAAFVMRRLRRVCAAVGNRRTKYVSCSATIANPAKHMRSIFGIDDIEVVTEDGSPTGRKDFILWNPPHLDPNDTHSARASSLTEACTLFRQLITRGIKTILFCKIRKTCELAMKTVRAQIAAAGHSDLLDRVRSYRGGYSQHDRREIEKQAFGGKLLGIIATNALELGINIGSLDAVVMLGFPITVASLRQQSGRAGRRLQDSLAVLVADPYPIDQHFVKNPDEIFDKPMADLIVDLENEVILEGHLQCAANEMPILPSNDEHYFGSTLFKAICEKKLVQDAEGWFHTHPKYKPRPSAHVAIRGGQEVKYTILDVSTLESDGKMFVLEEIELSRALFETYEGAIFMHQGATFLVKEVSHDERTARVVQTDVNWLTTPRDYTDIDPIQTLRIREIRDSPHRAYYGRILINTIIFGFFKVRNGSILDAVELETPPFKRETVGMWIDVPPPLLELLQRKGINPAEAIHAAEHTVLNMSPLFAFASDGDVRTECKVAEKEYAATQSNRKRPARLIFYDGSGKSSGVSAKAFDHSSDILRQALGRLEACECEEGCPSCIESSICRSANMVTSKLGATLVLRSVLNMEIDEDAIPDVDPEVAFGMLETVVAATGVQAVPDIAVEGAGGL